MAKEKIVIFHHDERGVAVHWSEVGDLVRCKDCEYYTEEEEWCRRLGLCGAFKPDDFCSLGRMKEAEEEGETDADDRTQEALPG